MALDDHKKADPIFNFDRIYLKDSSFEAPQCPQIFSQPDYNPKIDVQITISHQVIDEAQSTFEVVLKVTVTATTGGAPAFLVEVQQGGMFTISGLNKQDQERALEASCPNALFPFLREHVNRLITQGGFPSLLLQPVNFDAMYEQKKPSGDNESDKPSVAH